MRPIIKFLDHPKNYEEFLKIPNIHIAEGIDEDVSCIYTHFEKIDFDLYKNLRFVFCPCTNIDHLNAPENIRVFNLNNQDWLYHNVKSTAEWTLYAMLSLLRNNKDELNGKTVGFIGFGRIGQQVAKMLSGFNVRVIYYDIKEPMYYIKGEFKSLEYILVNSDIITIHLISDDSTYNFISDQEFDLIKAYNNKRPYFINSSRSRVVDGEALINAIETYTFSGVMLDVIEDYSTLVKDRLMGAISKYINNTILSFHTAGTGTVSRNKTDELMLKKLKGVLKIGIL